MNTEDKINIARKVNAEFQQELAYLESIEKTLLNSEKQKNSRKPRTNKI